MLAQLPLLNAADPAPVENLAIAVLQGNGAINNLRTGAVTDVIVEVRDPLMKPVPGAEVTFELPASGPGGKFSGGATTARAKTNTAGQARAQTLVPAGEGRFSIRVTAKLGDRVGSFRIDQTNSSKEYFSGNLSERKKSKLWAVLGVVGGGAVTGGLIMLSRGGGGSSSPAPSAPLPPTITLAPGSPTVGGPR
jgi:hypothetical protein